MTSFIKEFHRFLSPDWQSLHMDYKVDFKPRYGQGNTPPHEDLLKLINTNRPQYKLLLHESLSYSGTFTTMRRAHEHPEAYEPFYNNSFLPGLDIIGLYTLIAKFKPDNYIEVGSGNSTKVAYKAIRENGLKTVITSIDPQPRAEIDSLAQKVIREPFENTDLSFIRNLKKDDILFIDNSHRILPNSDSMVFFLEVLPKLAKGVVVHIHDIYLPYDYPQFMCDRFYSEQYGLAIALLSNPDKFEILFPAFFISQDQELHSILDPVWKHPSLSGVETHGGSFWFRIN